MAQDVLIAPASFKGSLSALKAGEVIFNYLKEEGLSSYVSPITDGGDDTLAILANFDSGFRTITGTVNGPLPEQSVEASYLVNIENRLIVIEAAQAHGLNQLPKKELAPMEATSYGVGELILLAQSITGMAADKNWTLLISLGGSASTDAGIGALQALGCRFYNEKNDPIQFKLNASAFSHIHQIIPPGSAFPENLEVIITADVDNLLLGNEGCARVFAPQKGAGEADIEYLERELSRVAKIFNRDFGSDFETLAGSGAAGGLGFGLCHIPNARLFSGAKLFGDFLELPERITESKIIITGEGSLDEQSLSGKATGYLIDLAKDKPVFIFCGQKAEGLSLPENVHVFPMVNEKFNINEAMYEPEKALEYALSQALQKIKSALNLVS